MNITFCDNLLNCNFGNSKLCKKVLECQAITIIKDLESKRNEQNKYIKVLDAESFGYPKEWDNE